MADENTAGPAAAPQSPPTVAVVIPARNEARNIGACLAAIAAQDYPAGLVSVVVVDNGSTDETPRLAAAGGAAVIVDAKATIARLRNLGAAACAGEVLAFLDADMIPSPGWLAGAVPVLREDRVGAVGGQLDIPLDAGWVERSWCLPRRFKPEKAESGWLPSGNLLVNREAFTRVGGFDEKLVTCEDVDICARLREAGFRLMFVKKAAVVHTGESKSAGAMFRKELWRGRNSIGRLPVIVRNPREIPSIMLPLAQLGLFVLPLVLLALGRVGLAAASLALTLGLPVLRALLVSRRLRTLRHFAPLVGVWYIYYLARAVAVVVR